MKSYEFINEDNESPRLDIEITGDWNSRVFFEATLQEKHRVEYLVVSQPLIWIIVLA
jgi:hypothetical protein